MSIFGRGVEGKLGNMRKAVRWTVYPHRTGSDPIVQSDKRIAQINLETGKAVLSDGKGGHNGFMHLSSFMGATTVDCPPDMIEAIRAVIAKDNGTGVVTVLG